MAKTKKKKLPYFDGVIPHDALTGEPLSYDGYSERTSTQYVWAATDVPLTDEERHTVKNLHDMVHKTKTIGCKYIPAVQKPNVPFNAVMRLVTYSRGRSAANIIVEQIDGPYPTIKKPVYADKWPNNQFVGMTDVPMGFSMFMSSFTEMVPQVTIEKGVVIGSWAFAKRGVNFGLVYLGPPTP